MLRKTQRMDSPLLSAKNGKDCGIACLRMIAAHYSRKINQNRMRQNNTIRRGINLIYDLGNISLQLGFSSTIVGYDYFLFKKQDIRHKSGSLKILHSRKYTGFGKQIADSCINFLNGGGKLILKMPTGKDINYFLKRKKPVIVGIRPKIFGFNCPANMLHYVVLSGKVKKTYKVLDPCGKKYFIDADLLLYAWYSRMALLLVIEP